MHHTIQSGREIWLVDAAATIQPSPGDRIRWERCYRQERWRIV
jgi:hypothetical protein